jgi:cysteine desulfurase
MIYLDYNATTPLDPEIRQAMLPFLGPLFGNPSSVHSAGRAARSLLDQARERTAGVLGVKPSEIIFTSGGTESNNLAILGSARQLRDRGRHLITSAIEHHAVLRCFEHLQTHEGFNTTLVPVTGDGRVDPEAVEQALRDDTVLVSVMAANNEVGTLQDVGAIAQLCRNRGVRFHTDAVQWFGKESLNVLRAWQAPLVSLCGHKFHGPKGAGLLYVESGQTLRPLSLGGPQELDRRAGTENMAAIMGLMEAVDRHLEPPVFPQARLRELSSFLREQCCAIPGVASQGTGEAGLANTVALTVEGCDSLTLLAGLDLEGICASSGSACAAGSLTPSHVLLALGVPPALASAFVRFSLGRDSTTEEIRRAVDAFGHVVNRARSHR